MTLDLADRMRQKALAAERGEHLDIIIKEAPRVPPGHGSPAHGGSSGEWTSGSSSGSGGEKRPPYGEKRRGTYGPARPLSADSARSAGAAIADAGNKWVKPLDDKEKEQLKKDLTAALAPDPTIDIKIRVAMVAAAQAAAKEEEKQGKKPDLINDPDVAAASQAKNEQMWDEYRKYAKEVTDNAIARAINAQNGPDAKQVPEPAINRPNWLGNPAGKAEVPSRIASADTMNNTIDTTQLDRTIHSWMSVDGKARSTTKAPTTLQLYATRRLTTPDNFKQAVNNMDLPWFPAKKSMTEERRDFERQMYKDAEAGMAKARARAKRW
jgi:hypothetical protein